MSLDTEVEEEGKEIDDRIVDEQGRVCVGLLYANYKIHLAYLLVGKREGRVYIVPVKKPVRKPEDIKDNNALVEKAKEFTSARVSELVASGCRMLDAERCFYSNYPSANVDSQGRVVIPKRMRGDLELTPGDELSFRQDEQLGFYFFRK